MQHAVVYLISKHIYLNFASITATKIKAQIVNCNNKQQSTSKSALIAGIVHLFA